MNRVSGFGSCPEMKSWTGRGSGLADRGRPRKRAPLSHAVGAGVQASVDENRRSQFGQGAVTDQGE